MDAEAKRWRAALVNEIAATFACEGCNPFALTNGDTIEPLTKEETAAVMAEALAIVAETHDKV